MVSGMQHRLNYRAVLTTLLFCGFVCSGVLLFCIVSYQRQDVPVHEVYPATVHQTPRGCACAKQHYAQACPCYHVAQTPCDVRKHAPGARHPDAQQPHPAFREALASCHGVCVRVQKLSTCVVVRHRSCAGRASIYPRYNLRVICITTTHFSLSCSLCSISRLRRCNVFSPGLRHRRLVCLQLRRAIIGVALPHLQTLFHAPPKTNHAYVDATFSVLASSTAVWYASSFAAQLSGSNSHTGEW